MTPSQAKERGIKVRALVWLVDDDAIQLKAQGFNSVYRIRQSVAGNVVWQASYAATWHNAEDQDAAKAAAQADYEARILAALE